MYSHCKTTFISGVNQGNEGLIIALFYLKPSPFIAVSTIPSRKKATAVHYKVLVVLVVSYVNNNKPQGY